MANLGYGFVLTAPTRTLLQGIFGKIGNILQPSEQSSRLNLICHQVFCEVSLAAHQNHDGWCSVPILIPFGGRTCKSQPAV